jgi:hypothetical protein
VPPTKESLGIRGIATIALIFLSNHFSLRVYLLLNIVKRKGGINILKRLSATNRILINATYSRG